MRHGPHHGAQKSTTTGTDDALTRASKTSAVGTSTGSPGADSGAPHFLHFTACADSWPYGMRLRCWQFEQVTMMPRLSTSVMFRSYNVGGPEMTSDLTQRCVRLSRSSGSFVAFVMAS